MNNTKYIHNEYKTKKDKQHMASTAAVAVDVGVVVATTIPFLSSGKFRARIEL